MKNKKGEIATQLSIGSNVHRKRWPSDVESDVWKFLRGYIAHKLAENTIIENTKVQVHIGEVSSS